jgi:hypothetical protein
MVIGKTILLMNPGIAERAGRLLLFHELTDNALRSGRTRKTEMKLYPRCRFHVAGIRVGSLATLDVKTPATVGRWARSNLIPLTVLPGKDGKP